MKQPRSRIAQTIADKTLGKTTARPVAKEIAAYLLAEHRVQELASIMRDVQADWAEAGHVEVMVTSAHPLTAAVESDITRQVKTVYPAAKRVVVTSTIDPAVVGGIKVRLAHQQFDASVASKLDTFKQLTTA